MTTILKYSQKKQLSIVSERHLRLLVLFSPRRDFQNGAKIRRRKAKYLWFSLFKWIFWSQVTIWGSIHVENMIYQKINHVSLYKSVTSLQNIYQKVKNDDHCIDGMNDGMNDGKVWFFGRYDYFGRYDFWKVWLFGKVWLFILENCREGMIITEGTIIREIRVSLSRKIWWSHQL